MDQNTQNPQNPQTNLPNQIVEPPIPEVLPNTQQVVGGLNEFMPESQVPGTADQVAPVASEVQPPAPMISSNPTPVNVEQGTPLIDNKELVDLSKNAASVAASAVSQSPSFDQASAPIPPNIEEIDASMNNSAPFSLPNNGNINVSSLPQSDPSKLAVAETDQQVSFAGEEEKPKGKTWPWVVSIILAVVVIIVFLFYYYNITISF
jgi:hypothetical protein